MTRYAACKLQQSYAYYIYLGPYYFFNLDSFYSFLSQSSIRSVLVLIVINYHPCIVVALLVQNKNKGKRLNSNGSSRIAAGCTILCVIPQHKEG
jgi:hypothetical protein